MMGCNPGASECVDSTSFHICTEYAIWGEPVSCLAGQSCVNGACEMRLGCNPGERECIDDSSYHVCGEHAIWNPAQPCLSYQSCSEGRCLPEPQCSQYQQTRCAPNDQNKIEICNSQHQWETYRTCDYGCSSGYCRACRPGDTRCADSYRYQTCDSSGQWGSDYSCGNNMVCRSGSCVISPFAQCSRVGDLRCSPQNINTLQRCGENYQWSDFSFCPMGCFSAACRVCSTGELHCRDSQTYQKCTDNGQWGYDTSCPTGFFCFLGSCQAPTGNQCSKIGDKRCSPSNSNTLQQCGNNYVYQDYMACPEGCINGVCAECKPGTSLCSGATTYRTCTKYGQLSNEQSCASGYICDSGSCVARPQCENGQRSCISDSVYSCVDGQWQLLFHCPFDNDCKESSGTAYCAPESRQNQSSQPVQPSNQSQQPQQAATQSDGISAVLAVTTLLFGAAAAYLYIRAKK